MQELLDQAQREVLEYFRLVANISVPLNVGFVKEVNIKSEQDAYWHKRRSTFISNTAYAVFGGLSLIVPMLIMTLHPTRLTTLLTSSLFIFAVVATLAGVMDTAEPKDIVGATAAYAAVLVVFVGTGGGSTNAGVLSSGIVAGIVIGSLAGAAIILLAVVDFLGLFGPQGAFNDWWRKWRFGTTNESS